VAPAFPADDAERLIEAARAGGATSLTLAGLDLDEVPDSVRGLTTLTGLYLYTNRLTGLPDWLGELSGLQRLSVMNNQLERLPESLTQLTGLTTLGLSFNTLRTVPEWLGDLPALTHLDLTVNGLSELPASLGRLTGLDSLVLAGNWLTRLPDPLTGLAELTKLNVNHNELAALPDAIGDLRALTTLNLSVNRLTDLPASFSELGALTSLDLSHNRFTTAPPAIAALLALRTCRLGGNAFDHVPESLTRLPLTDHDFEALAPLPAAPGPGQATDVWFHDDRPLADLAARIGTEPHIEDAENHWEWVVTTFEGMELDITRAHGETETRVFRYNGDSRIFPPETLQALATALLATGITAVSIGRWHYREDDEFDRETDRVVTAGDWSTDRRCGPATG
jgi:hypothetical protein